MKLLKIKDVTDKENKKTEDKNNFWINCFDGSYQAAKLGGAPISSEKFSYLFEATVMFEEEEGLVGEVGTCKFGRKSDGGKIFIESDLAFSKEVDDFIENSFVFMEKYSSELSEGKDINEIISDDDLNLLKYFPSGIRKILRKK